MIWTFSIYFMIIFMTYYFCFFLSIYRLNNQHIINFVCEHGIFIQNKFLNTLMITFVAQGLVLCAIFNYFYSKKSKNPLDRPIIILTFATEI